MKNATDEDEYCEDDDPGMRPTEMTEEDIVRASEGQLRQPISKYGQRRFASLRAFGTHAHPGVAYGRSQGFPVIFGVSDKQCDWAAAIREKHHKTLKSKARQAHDAGNKERVAEIRSEWESCRDKVEAAWWIRNKDCLPGA